MIKKLIAASLFAVTLSTSAQAQQYPGDAGSPLCTLTGVFSFVTPTACVGFFGKNSIVGSTGDAVANPSDAWTAIGLLGGTPGNILFKTNWGGVDPFPNATPMYGVTIIGLHWGNYPGAPGNVSSFYKFDAGPGGIVNPGLLLTSGISNFAIYSTNTQEVPEPASFALVAAGVLGLVGVARRRRNTV